MDLNPEAGRGKKSIEGPVGEEVELARELGVSLRRLYGWEPTQVTEHEYDADGRMLRTVTTVEPEWTPDEVALFLASRRREQTMGPYGVPLERATAKDARFVADPIPTMNKAVAAVEAAKTAYFKAWPKADRASLMWSVREMPASS